MTEHTADPAAEDVSTTDTPEPPQDDTTADAAGDDATDGNPGREAAKYRRKLRETETERDQLREVVAGMRRAEVERIAGANVQNPAGLWAAGIDLADLLDPAGQVDPAKVQAATQQAADTLGLARPRPNNYVAREGTNSSPRSHGDDMASVIRG